MEQSITSSNVVTETLEYNTIFRALCMTQQSANRLLIHVTNIPTPYRISFCNALNEVLNAFGYGFHVLYCAEREANRYWTISFNDMRYPHEVLPGISPQVGALQAHFNPDVVQRLRQLNPEFLLTAGGWNMPTALLAASPTLCGPAFRIFWSEGHADAVLNPSGPIAWLRRKCLRAYDAFAVPNDSSAHFLEMELGFRSTILPLPNTVDDDFFRVARSLDKVQVRQQLGLPLHANIFVSVTRLDDEKGVRELVAAMSLLQTRAGNCVLVLVGEGALRKELQAAIGNGEGDVRLVGQQDACGVRNYLAAADAFVLATKRDPNPLAVIEAAFAGVPLIVSSKAGNVKELVHDGHSGMIISTIDSAAISALLARFCQLSELERQEMGNNAAQMADAGFQRRKVARHFVTALLALRTTT
ncbi:MAG: glycosyltransferase family 4 protein [Chloroflexi bacterium]|nr:glycosyltransferase family 4 protein [Chloroflexota bacterium]